MGRYISTYITGFNQIVQNQLLSDLKSVKIIENMDGMIFFEYAGNAKNISNLLYLNNTYNVIYAEKSHQLTFKKIVTKACSKGQKYVIDRGTFRVRYVKENQFSHVDREVNDFCEKYIIRNSALKLDRLNPSTEFWCLVRSEGWGFFAQLLYKRKTSEKQLHKGELRPELAYLLCCCVNYNHDSIVCDPFCGYGAIPKQLIKKSRVSKVYASDINKDCVHLLKKDKAIVDAGVILRNCDARNLIHIPNNSIDSVITDPPWGMFEEIDNIENFYHTILVEFLRILKPTGIIVLLTACKNEFTRVLLNNEFKDKLQLCNNLNILVNGKKSGVFVIKRK